MSEDETEGEPFAISMGASDSDSIAASLSDDGSREALDRRILNIVRASPNNTVRPARVASELGISFTDACAELCGLLAAVGGGYNGASFHFEKIDGADVMVFSFPKDYESRALRNRTYNDFWTTLRRIMVVSIRFLKIITAFGLILSLLIVCVAAILGLLAVFIGISRGTSRGDNHRSLFMHQIRSLCYTMRQLLWFYALFGPDQDGQDPFLREIAYDLSLAMSICCGNPASLFYWIRAQHLARRRRHTFRRWGRSTYLDSDVDGVTLVRPSSWATDNSPDSGTRASLQQDSYRGLLSIAVEFLFGPEPSSPDDASYPWKLRAAVIMDFFSRNNAKGFPLLRLAPYLDNPAADLDDTTIIVQQALLIVTHFNGIPQSNTPTTRMIDAAFTFPELLAESSVPPLHQRSPVSDEDTWQDFLCAPDENASYSTARDVPEYLKEERYKFTKLTAQQLTYCASLGVLNFVGVWWLAQSVQLGGVLELTSRSLFGWFIKDVLIAILRGYAVLFLAIPLARLLVLVVLNTFRKERNRRRQHLAQMIRNI